MIYLIGICVVLTIIAGLYYRVRQDGKYAQQNKNLKETLNVKEQQEKSDSRPALDADDLIRRMRNNGL